MSERGTSGTLEGEDLLVKLEPSEIERLPWTKSALLEMRALASHIVCTVDKVVGEADEFNVSNDLICELLEYDVKHLSEKVDHLWHWVESNPQ